MNTFFASLRSKMLIKLMFVLVSFSVTGLSFALALLVASSGGPLDPIVTTIQDLVPLLWFASIVSLLSYCFDVDERMPIGILPVGYVESLLASVAPAFLAVLGGYLAVIGTGFMVIGVLLVSKRALLKCWREARQQIEAQRGGDDYYV